MRVSPDLPDRPAGRTAPTPTAPQATNRDVVIVQYRLTHYRIRFYELLRGLLSEKGVRLRVVYSAPSEEPGGGDPINALYAHLPWGERVPSRVLPGGFVRQPILRRTRKADLVIVSDGTKHMLNYAPYLLPVFKRPKIAFWGHGWNHHTDTPNSRSERMKFWLTKRVDWYFAYTWYVRQAMVERGCDAERITDVQNAVEGPPTEIDPDVVAQLSEELGLAPGSRAVFYCGKMYPMKRLPLLIEAAARAHAEVPSLVLILAGAGSDQGLAQEAARNYPFVRYVGPVLDKRKAALYALSRLVVLPGLVGLGVVEAFHHGIPPVATRFPHHSPEFVYLRDGVNGLVVDATAEGLSAAIVRLATDDALHARLAAGCAETAETLSVEEMARRFADGVLKALERPPR